MGRLKSDRAAPATSDWIDLPHTGVSGPAGTLIGRSVRVIERHDPARPWLAPWYWLANPDAAIPDASSPSVLTLDHGISRIVDVNGSRARVQPVPAPTTVPSGVRVDTPADAAAGLSCTDPSSLAPVPRSPSASEDRCVGSGAQGALF